jgi:acyl transferase domain-containing protein/NAD(P)H-dependent flavin oxidoreductase YrpB (nitropropane dioxygenase family)
MDEVTFRGTALIDDILNVRFRILAITPFERSDHRLAAALLRHDIAVAIDAGRNPAGWDELARPGEAACPGRLGVRIADHVVPGFGRLPDEIGFLVVAGELDRLPPECWRVPVIAQVCSVAQAARAIDAGASGLIAKGQESGGLCGDESSFVLLQRVLALAEHHTASGAPPVPVWCQGGIGLNTAAGAFAGGAFGVVIDTVLAGYPQTSAADSVKQQILSMDGSEVQTASGYQVYARGQRQVAALGAMNADGVRSAIEAGTLLPVGQDAALARLVLAECPTLESLINTLRTRSAAQIVQARKLRVLDEGNAWARAHGTRYPVAQGPMTRVSDTPDFAEAVADAGGLPFLALSMMRAAPSRALMEATRDKLGDRPWGVGVLAFAAADIVEPHLALVRELKPNFLVLAGGRPAQARPFVEMGIPTYLHVPSPGLLDMFLKDGATHFIFEGRECGGHVGPRYSHVLWEQALALLEKTERPEELNILFAGGVHDARSGAMVAAIAAGLAARGAKIGVLMGSAYIATHEAVESGAVLPAFQRQALAGDRTVLVETAPGHAIRCLPTGFIDLFDRERRRLQAEGVERKEVWRALEHLTVGRLRIATKGVDYVDGALTPIDDSRQAAEGMYMLGQIIALRREITSMAELHRAATRDATAHLQAVRLPPLRAAAGAAPVAIIGMACLFPGSPDLEAYWANIVQGRDLVGEVPAERWNVAQYFSEGTASAGKTASKWGGFIEAAPFDPLKYGIPPQSLAAIEPAQLLSLHVASQALRDAGLETKWFDRETTSVIFGAESGMDLANQYNFRNLYPQYCGELPPALEAALPSLTEDSFPGVLVNVISGRIANRLGLGGVNYAVDSACASALTAIELAVKELRAGSSSMVLAGGADFHNGISDFLMFSSAGALSPSGRCRSFDHNADGIALGEGVGIVVLKLLEDAERDGDRIYAVIEGIAGSSDGRGLGLTAPRKEGQKRALERAYWQAGVLPAAVGLVEAHGTGTVLGDRTELETLTEIFAAGGAVPGQAALGSVKSQIGHTKCAAGIAGMIKVAKALHHRVLPPTRHIETPNAAYRPATSPFRLNGVPAPWSPAEGPARAAVSAFGFGGTNFHAVLRAHAPHHSQAGTVHWPAELFAVRGHSEEEAADTLRRLAAFVASSDAPFALRDLARAAWAAGAGPVQVAFAAENVSQVRARAADALMQRSGHGVHRRPVAAVGKIACLFAGQGSQYPGMLRDLFVHVPLLQSMQAGTAYLDLIYPPCAHDAESRTQAKRRLTETRNAQPALGLVELAAFGWLERLGLKPDMAGGHSYGELAALAAAGAFDAATLLSLSRARADCIMAALGEDPGAMAAVRLDAASLAPHLADFPGVVAANRNSPVQTVISGPSDDVRAACLAMEKNGVGTRPIATACAFHSPMMQDAEHRFARVLAGHPVGRPRWPVYANATAAPMACDAAAIRENLARHLVSPVRFVEQIERMHDDGARVFIEIGPRQVLTGLIGRILHDRPHSAVALDAEAGGFAGLLGAVAQLAVLLPDFDAAALFEGRMRDPIDLDVPAKLPAATWMIDGGRARPLHGQPPAHAGAVVTAPVVSNAAASATPALAAPAEQALVGYLSNMRDMINAQRDVLLGYFGAAQVPSPVRQTESVARAVAPVSRGDRAPASQPPAGPDRTTLLLDIVSRQTGYPAEMLDLDLDLEADLSIDSIKRAEVIGELARSLDLQAALGGGTGAGLEQLAGRKTLRGVIAWLDAHVPSGPAQMVAPQPVEAPTSPAPAALIGSALLLDVVSRCTGYPAEMLDPDLDLEADLSIDSIKRAEIVAQFISRAGIAGGGEGGAAQEHLAGLKTLRAMMSWVEQRAGPLPAATSMPPAAPAADAAPARLTRYVTRWGPEAAEARDAGGLAQEGVLITEDGLGVAAALAARLAAHGALPRVATLAEIRTQPPEMWATHGLIHLAGPGAGDAKTLFPLLRDALLGGAHSVLLGANLAGGAAAMPPGAGLAGLLKCASREFPAVRACLIDLDFSEPAEQLAAAIESEILGGLGACEVMYRDGQRSTPTLVAEALPDAPAAAPALGRDSVVLLTGGARGITARVAVALARRTGCRIELVGRSALPGAAESACTAGITDTRQLRQALLAQFPGGKPAEIEVLVQRLLADREIRKTLAEIGQAGSPLGYTAVDVRDRAAFAAHIDGIYARHGRIDGVIHGAGLIEDRLIRDKTDASFARVFDTKVEAALALREKIRADAGFVVFFSSVSSVFGNRGQVDYAAANDVLDRMAGAWQAQVPGRVVSVNWGPWADTGMVSDGVRGSYRRRGIGLIPQDQGVAALLRELGSGRRDPQVVLMCGAPENFMA